MPVNTTHAAAGAMQEKWRRCRDAVAGQDAVHKAGVSYLPKLEGQNDPEYGAYKARALYYNASGRTLEGLIGLIFRKPPMVKLPDALADLAQDVDTAGTPLETLCRKAVGELLQVGRFGLLADYSDQGVARTQAEERERGARPYLVLYSAESVINWRRSKINGRWQYVLVVIQVDIEKPKDVYAAETVTQWHVHALRDGVYTVETFERKKEAQAGSADEFILVGTALPRLGGQPMREIPFLICGPNGISDEVAKPPMLDLVDVNLSHYRTSADYEHGLHFTGLPTPYVTGHTFNEGEVFALGAAVVKGISNPNAKLAFLEFEGKGLENLSGRLEEKADMMVALGARMLATQKRQVEAAETAAIHRAGENSVLAALAHAAGRAIAQGLTWCAERIAVAGEIRVELNSDFLPAGLSAQELTSLVSAWQAGAISHETLYDNLKRGEIAQQDVDFEEEKDRIEAEPPKLGAISTGADPDDDGNGE